MLFKKLSDIAPDKNFDSSENAFADIFSIIFNDNLRYVPEYECWFYYDGVCWCKDLGHIVTSNYAIILYKILSLYGSKKIRNLDKRKKYLEKVSKYGNFAKREALIKDAKYRMSKSIIEFDNNPNLFNCQNCTIDLTTLEAHVHSSTDFITKVSGCEFNPEADGKLWNKTLSEVFCGDLDLIRYFQEINGYILTANTYLEKAFFAYGPKSRNGKSTTLVSIFNTLGKYAVTIPPEALGATSFNNCESASPQAAQLIGARLVLINEPSKTMKLNASLFKSMTGGDPMSVRELYKSPITFTPQFKLIINCNHLPEISDDTVFKSDRVRVIPFDRCFNPVEQDTHLKEKLSNPEVRSSILNWALEGLQSFRSSGERLPDKVVLATNTYREKPDSIAIFVQECLVKADENTSGSKVYDAYCKWCFNKKLYCVGKTAFFKELRQRGLMRTATVEGDTNRNAVIDHSVII